MRIDSIGNLTRAIFFAIALVMASAISTVARAAEPLPRLKDGDWAALKMTWDQPEPEATMAGTPIGNGHIGAKIKGGVGTDVLQLNDKHFWSGGPGLTPPDPKRRVAMEATRKALAAGDIPGADAAAKGMWGDNNMGTFLPLGTLSLTFDHGDTATGYARTLDLDRAVSTITYTIDGVTYTREAFASFPDDVIVVRLSASTPGKISLTARLTYPAEMEGHGGSVAASGDQELVLNTHAPGNAGWDDRLGMRAQGRLRAAAAGGTTRIENGALRIDQADSAVLIFVNATNYNGFDKEPGSEGVEPASIAKAMLFRVADKSYDQLLQAHVADYQSIFRRVWVDLNGEKAAPHVLGFQYTRYDMIACSRTGDRPHNQQGMWNSKWKPTSQSAHWLNENVEKYYSLIETANLPECGEPLWNWMKELSINGAKHAAVDWGFRGWLAGSCSDIWAKTSLASGNNEWSIWPVGGIWLCENLFDHYAFSGDQTFLRERAYPILKGACEFAIDYLVEDKDGHLVTSPSTSAENRFGLTEGATAYAVTTGSTMDIALIRQLFENTIEATKVLNIDADFRTKLEATKAKLLPFKIGANGELQEWAEDYSRLPADPRKRFTPHRHASHIISVWPLSQITAATPDLFNAAKLALENRGRGGYHPDKGAMWARLHEGDKALASGDSMPVGLRMTGQTPPKYAAFPELFVQSHTGAIELLPALPTTFKSGHIAGLRARGGYELSLEWNDGQLVRCQIDSKLGTTPLVRYAGKPIDLSTDTRFAMTGATAAASK